MENAKRSFIVFMVVVFAISSLATTGFVIWEIAKGNKSTTQDSENQQKAAELQKQLNEQKAQQGGNKLEGTQLADFNPVQDVTELQKIDTVVGTGAEVKPGDTVTAHYTGAVASTGKIFQSSLDSGQPIPFSLSQVIKGWTDGVPGMKEGGKRRLIIPAEQAYGANPPQGSGIPANAPLVFDIELVKIGQ